MLTDNAHFESLSILLTTDPTEPNDPDHIPTFSMEPLSEQQSDEWYTYPEEDFLHEY